jgi:hypothetical protein
VKARWFYLSFEVLRLKNRIRGGSGIPVISTFMKQSFGLRQTNPSPTNRAEHSKRSPDERSDSGDHSSIYCALGVAIQ